MESKSIDAVTDFIARRTMMVDTQVRPSDVTKFPIIEAMLSIQREYFVPASQREASYMDGNVSLGEGRVLLEPRTFAKMLDALDIGIDELVLDVGSGFGYSSSVIAHMAQAVVALEEDNKMAEEAQEVLTTIGADNVITHRGPLVMGAAELGPYDVIIVQGGVEIIPMSLSDQLKNGGRMVCLFMDEGVGEVRIGYKLGGRFSWRRAFNAGAPVLNGFERNHFFQL